MDTKNKTRVAYRCPYCGAVITFDVTPERLKSRFNLTCIQCHKSQMEISMLPGDVVSLTVPCLMCPHSHPYKISSEMFFSKDIYTFPCSFSGLDICFIGNDEDLVDDEIDASGALIRAMLKETEDEDLNAKDAGVMVADTAVMREVMFAIGELDKQKKIKCKCQSKSFKVLLDYDKAIIVCKVCSNKKEIAARTRFDANAAIDMEEIEF
ncbi:MAG: hypothetical protein J6K12_07315 [Clostridia bacterium]|nr:hypothetical protein [Clostridia bacterium]